MAEVMKKFSTVDVDADINEVTKQLQTYQACCGRVRRITGIITRHDVLICRRSRQRQTAEQSQSDSHPGILRARDSVNHTHLQYGGWLPRPKFERHP